MTVKEFVAACDKMYEQSGVKLAFNTGNLSEDYHESIYNLLDFVDLLNLEIENSKKQDAREY